ncbi:MAG: hypothetical protein H6510_12325 [Acidobacteria bacterium]|nr:hypothetical protein [Acidobacteriota bacterium]MCB9398592.1 hypothetical protein [Acidobacteriota bacterium]
MPFEVYYHFQPRWKEELVCTCNEGSFCLEYSMGSPWVYLPSESSWQQKAPAWAANHWSSLKDQLESWCKAQNSPLTISDTAPVYSA